MSLNVIYFTSKLFGFVLDLTCGPFPGPGSSEHKVVRNPMMEYINNHDAHVVEMFDQFKNTHKKSYQHDLEHSQRMNNFRQNLRYIDYR